MKIIRYIIAAICLAAGLSATFRFDGIAGFLAGVSADREISAFMMLRMRIVLISFFPVGLALLFREQVFWFIEKINSYLVRYGPGTFLSRVLWLAVILRVGALLIMPFHLWGDYGAYDELGWNLAQTGCYCVDGIATAYRPPGYPFVLAMIYTLIGHKPAWAAGYNIIFSIIIVASSYGLARELFSERIARWTALMLAVIPSQILFCNLLASEIVFTALLVLAIMIAVRFHDKYSTGSFIVAGIILGGALLIRPIALPVLGLIFLHFVLNRGISKKLVMSFGAGILAFMIVVGPWMLRNYEVKGTATISTISGINLLAGNSPGAGFGWNPGAVGNLPIGDPEKEVMVDQIGRKRAWEYIKANPGSFVVRGIMKTAYLFAVDLEGVDYHLREDAELKRFGSYSYSGVFMQVIYFLVLAAGIFGIYFSARKGFAKNSAVLWLTILYWIAVHFVFYAEGRYRFPIMPMIVIYGSYFLAEYGSKYAKE